MLLTFVECGCCDHLHRPDYHGDCRNDAERFSLAQLDQLYGENGYVIEGDMTMGYTHYWTQTRDFTPEEFGDIAASVRKIIDTATGREGVHNYDDKPPVPLVICGGDGTGEPILSKEKISFNGQGPNLDHETFYLEAKRELPYEGARPDQLGWAFCKTAQKPYDVVVVACLTMLAADYGYSVGSDGDAEDWHRGGQLAEEALGKQFANPLVKEALLEA